MSSLTGGTDIVAIGTTDILTLNGNITIYQVSTKTLLATYYGNSTSDKYFGQLLHLDQRSTSYMVIYVPSNTKAVAKSTYSYISMIRILLNPNTNAFATTISLYQMSQTNGNNGVTLQGGLTYSTHNQYTLFLYNSTSTIYVYGFYTCDYNQYYDTSNIECSSCANSL